MRDGVSVADDEVSDVECLMAELPRAPELADLTCWRAHMGDASPEMSLLQDTHWDGPFLDSASTTGDPWWCCGSTDVVISIGGWVRFAQAP